MQKLLLFIDKVSTWVGQAFSWLIVALTVLISWEVFSRYALDHPHAWAFDVMIMMYGTLFMMAGAYTLAKNGHVRGDVLYGFFQPRTAGEPRPDALHPVLHSRRRRARLCRLLLRADSWAINEHSNITADGPPVYPFKTVIPVAGAFLLVQGIVEIIRCVICLRAGRLAVARGGRRGSRRRQAEGDGARQGRGHREARRIRGRSRGARK